MNEPPTCKQCGQLITEGQRWEYWKGAYPVGTPESAKERIHGACVSALLRETLAAFARVPEDRRDEITFEV